MTKQLNFYASEQKTQNQIKSLTCISCALDSLQYSSPSLIKEIENFAKRNNLLQVSAFCINCKKRIYLPCHSCLKAHIEKTVKDANHSKNIQKLLPNLTKVGLGHDGYYLDNDNLIEI